MKALIKRQVTNRVVKVGEPISFRRKVSIANGATYFVVNSSATVAAAGEIHLPPSGLTIRASKFDMSGADLAAQIATLKAGDILTFSQAGVEIGTMTLTTAPILTADTFSFAVNAITSYSNGPYTVKATIV